MDTEDGGGRENGKGKFRSWFYLFQFWRLLGKMAQSRPAMGKKKGKKKRESFCIGFDLLCLLGFFFHDDGKQSVAKLLTFHEL